MTTVPSELWVWARGRVLDEDSMDEWLPVLVQCATDVVLVLNDRPDSSDAFNTFRPYGHIARATERLQNEGITVHGMSWMRADNWWAQSCAAVMSQLAFDLGWSTVMLDAEGAWAGSGDASSREAAAAAFYRVWTELAANQPRQVGVGITDVPLRSASTVAPLVEEADYAVPQAYSFAHRTDIREPGVLQSRNYAWVPDDMPIVMGQAAYGTQTLDSMARCVDAASERGVVRSCWWDMLPLANDGAAYSYLAAMKKAIVGGGCP